MQELKVVFSDVDGTLLRDDKSLSDKNREAINALRDKGIHFVITTGRGPMAVETIYKQIGFKTDLIAYSGEYIIRDGKAIFSTGFSYDEAKEIVDFLDSNSTTYGIYSEELWISPVRTELLAEEEALVDAECIIGTIELLNRNAIINKFLAISTPEQVNTLIAKLRQRFPNYDIVKSLDYLVEINRGGQNKGTACKKYCELYNIDTKQALCFGDCYNDLEMLRLMPSVCIMGNAPEDIKEEFAGNPDKKIIESNMNDGIYHELYRRGYVE